MRLPISFRTTGCILLAVCTAAYAGDEASQAAIEQYVVAYVEAAAFDGVVLVARGDEIVYRQAFGMADYALGLPMSQEAVFRIASLSKQVTQAAIGRLMDQDKLDLDSSLSAFLPDFPHSRRITLRQLVDHTAGVAHTNRLEWMDMRSAYTLDEIIDGLSREPLLFEPGEDARYSNGGYALLARVIEVVSGRSYGDFIRQEFAENGFPIIGHESAYAVVPGMVTRYAPGPVYGDRVLAETYMTVNRIGGGSLYAGAEDVWRFFRASFNGGLVSPGATAALFPEPEDGDIQVTGRSPGALAQIFMDFDDQLAVVTLSSNSAWPAGFNSDIVALFRGQEAELAAFAINDAPLGDEERAAIAGDFIAERFGWEWSIVPAGNQFAVRQDALHTAFVRTTAGEFHLPVYDWLCRFSDYGTEFECRQRDPDAEIRFRFLRR